MTSAFVSGFLGGSILRGDVIRNRKVPIVSSRSVRVVTHAVATPVRAPTSTKDPLTDPLAQRPPFSLEDVRKAIPEHLWKKDTLKSVSYLVRDVAIVFALAYAAVTINNPVMWAFYYLAQGTMMWALFVIVCPRWKPKDGNAG